MISNIKKNFMFYVIVLQILMLPILPAMDGSMNPLRYVVYILFAIMSIAVVVNYIILKKLRIDIAFKYILSFVVMCGISATWSFSRGIPITDIIRGLLPFVWFIYILIMFHSLKGLEFDHVLMVISIVALIYAIRIVVYYMIYVAGHKFERVTFFLVQSTSIMPMIGTLIFLYYCIRKSKFSIPAFICMLICYTSVIITETKSMQLSLLIGFIIYLTMYFRSIRGEDPELKKAYITNGLKAITLIIICTVVIFMITNAGTRWANTVSIDQKINVIDTGSISVRIIELQTAFKNWLSSPVLGQGIGFRWQADGLDYGGPVIYMHNILAFVLMNFGIIGILYIVLAVVGIFTMIIKTFKRKVINTKPILVLFSIVIMAFLYANFFAVYRNIDYVIALSALIAMMLKEYISQKDMG